MDSSPHGPPVFPALAEETTLQNAVASAADSANSPVILQVLTECYEDYLSRLINSGTVRSENACNSTSEAVDHFVRGDEEMAGNANRMAGESPASTSEEDRAGGGR